jgi:hypothetical protein
MQLAYANLLKQKLDHSGVSPVGQMCRASNCAQRVGRATRRHAVNKQDVALVVPCSSVPQIDDSAGVREMPFFLRLVRAARRAGGDAAFCRVPGLAVLSFFLVENEN